MVRRSLVLLLSAALLASCGGSSDDPAVLPQERQVGAEQHPQLLAEFGGAYEGPEARYVARVGERIAAAAGLREQCNFTLVNTDVVNAFAVPGCYIYVTRGLFGIVNSEAELASVLGHEVGHIVAAHSRRQQRRSLLTGLGALAVGLLTGSERLAAVAGRTAELFTLRYSRKQEFESDELGIGYMRSAGYDPGAAAGMLQSLGRHDAFQARARGGDDAKSIPAWARTHPLTDERIQRARQEAAATGPADRIVDGEEPYLREVDNLLYGDDPQQGFVLGRRFAHPAMRISFEAPQGYTLTNSPAAVLIDGQDGARGQFGGAALHSGGLEAHASALVEQLLGGASSVQLGDAQRTVINGLETIIVPANVRSQQGEGEVTVAVYRAGGQAYHFIIVAPAGTDPSQIARLIGSFRMLTAEEVQSLRPRVIEVVRVGPGDTPATMAARMAVEGDRLQHFLMLNDRDAGAPLRPGEAVKLVSYRGR